MTREEKINTIADISKEEQVHEILMDLLDGMDYLDVTLTHERGSLPENGKDIVASKNDIYENKKEWTAFVIKKGDVRGTSQGVREIKAQIADCFTYSWHSISKGKNIRINKVKVVTNGKYNSGAIQKILEDNDLNNPNVSFWSGEDLVRFIDLYCDRIWLKGNRDYKKYIEIFHKKNREDDFAKAIGVKNEKIKKIIDYAIQPKLTEISVNDLGDLRTKYFDSYSVATLNDNVLIVGEAGSGKSTFFKMLSRDIIEQNFIRNDYELYPFIIKFSDFVSHNFNVIETISAHLKSDYDTLNIDFVKILQDQKFVIFIDALDEIGDLENKEKALKAVQDFKVSYPKVRIYCSSRPADSLIESCQKINFRYLEIDNVTMRQVEQFMSKYFDEDQIKCKRLIKSLRDTNLLDKMPKTPLTLALVAAIFDENQYEIPATISDLYKYFVDTLLNKQFNGRIADIINIGVNRSVISYLAEHLHKNRIKSIERTKLFSLISDFSAERGHKYDVNKLIDEFTKGLGLLIENDRNEIQFKHLSFQEYLTAYQYYNHIVEGKSNFIENFNDIWWQNVAIFFAGMTKDSPQLMKEILDKSAPSTFHDCMVNLSGIGYLMQALYNTPISARVEGIKRNLISTEYATSFLLTTKDENFDYLKKLYNTRFGVFKVIAHWYEFHHNSVTLREPLEIVFGELMENITDNNLDEKQRGLSEYYAYVVADTLFMIGDEDFKHLNDLYLNMSQKNFTVLSLIDSTFTFQYRKMSKENRSRKSIKRFKQRLDLMDKNLISDKVNTRLIDGTKIITFPERPRPRKKRKKK